MAINSLFNFFVLFKIGAYAHTERDNLCQYVDVLYDELPVKYYMTGCLFFLRSTIAIVIDVRAAFQLQIVDNLWSTCDPYFVSLFFIFF